MHESDEDLRELQKLLDRTFARANPHLTSIVKPERVVGGGPIEGGIFACGRQPVERAGAQGLYAPWVPSSSDVTRLKQIFPDGVCEHTKGDAGLSPERNAKGRCGERGPGDGSVARPRRGRA